MKNEGGGARKVGGVGGVGGCGMRGKRLGMRDEGGDKK